MIREILTFDGGLSTKKDAHLIERNEGIVCENVDLEKGSLTPLPSLVYLDNVVGKYIYPYNELLISNASDADDRFYDTYNDRIYWSNSTFGTFGLMRYDGTDAGTDAVAPLPLTQTEADTYITIAEDTSSTGLLTNGATYTYALTIVDAEDIESAPIIHGTSPAMTGKDNSVKFTVTYANFAALQAAHPDMVSFNIYRTGGDNPTFNLIAEGMVDTHPEVIDTGTSYTWNDRVADIDVSRIEMSTFDDTPPFDGLDMLIEVNGTMWGSVGHHVYFSRTGFPEYWGLLDYVKLDKECTGLGKFGDSLVAFTRTSAYLITGDTRDTVSLTRLPFNQGCIAKHSVVNIDSYLVWTSLNGICIFNGATIDILTDKILSWDEFGRVGDYTYSDFDATTTKWDSSLGFNITFAVGYQDRYYGVYSDGILVLDLAEGLKVSTIALVGTASLAINYDDNLLYALVPNITSGFDVYYLPSSSDSVMTARWKTARLDDNSTDVMKHYRDVELEAMPVSVEVFIDGVSIKTYTGQRQFKLPAGTFGKDIQFEIKTTNPIRSLKYEYSTLKA